ncbi:MAG: DUF3326 domain-containing protein, partial [Cyanobacteriota bacterium]
APQLTPTPSPRSLWSNDVKALVIPASACGGSAVLSWAQTDALIIAVENNRTQLQVLPEPLGVKTLRVSSYLEALGVLVAHRQGVNLACFDPQIPTLPRLSEPL